MKKSPSPAGMQGFIYNTRRPVFADINVRKALAHAFDFEWSNKQFAYNEYTRTNSYFENSDLAAPDGPPSGMELKILESYRGRIPDEIFTTRYAPPKNDGTGNMRENLRIAAQILDDGGWKLGPDGIRANAKGEKLKFEIIDSNPMFERWVLPFIANMKKIGVAANFRVLDPAQYQNRMNDFDFDMTVLPIGQSDSPGNEQRDFWGSDKADIPGSRNYIGIKDKTVDEIIEKIIRAKSREELVALTHALDRILLAGYYVIPQWHTDHFNLAYWKKLERPKTLSRSRLASATWWANSHMKSRERLLPGFSMLQQFAYSAASARRRLLVDIHCGLSVFIRSGFLLFDLAQKLYSLSQREFFAQCTNRAVAGNFIVLDLLRGDDQRGVKDRPFFKLLDRGFSFLDQALHRFTGNVFRFHIDHVEDAVDGFQLLFGFFQVLLEPFFQRRVRRGLGHFFQCLR